MRLPILRQAWYWYSGVYGISDFCLFKDNILYSMLKTLKVVYCQCLEPSIIKKDFYSNLGVPSPLYALKHGKQISNKNTKTDAVLRLPLVS